MFTVHQLRKLGYKVTVHHTRNEIEKNRFCGMTYELDPRGGHTHIEVYDMAEQNSYIGEALCSEKDNYDKKLGVRIALGRALKKMGM
jgi:hypothetical protein